MQKIKTYLILAAIIIVIAAFVTVTIQYKAIIKLKSENKRVTHNYEVVQDSARLIKGENNLLARRFEAQNLTMNEIRIFNQNIVADIADMKIQLRKITNITAFNTETTNHINTYFRKDSTRIDTLPLETLDYSDRWLDLHICKEGLKAKITSQSRDSLIQVLHWDYTGKFWPTRFLTKKEYYQDIKSMNPNSKITYSKWIIPVKKKGLF